MGPTNVFSAVADTGAALSYISQDVVDRLQPILALIRGPCVLLADGREIATTHRATISVRLGPVLSQHDFAVLPSLPADCLLGLDFMGLHDICVDPKRRLLRFTDFPDLPVSFDGCADSFLVCCARDTLIRANSEVWIPSSSKVPAGCLYICEPVEDAELAKRVFLGRTLTDGPPQAVLVANLGSKPRMLRKGSGLATCTKVARDQVFPSEVPPSSPNSQSPYRLPEDVFVGQQLSPSQRQSVVDLLTHFGPVLFSTDEKPYGRTPKGQHFVETGDHPPISQGMRPTAPADRMVVREEVHQMLKTGAVRPSCSPWASPIVLVRKKDGSVRFCVDYRKLNEVTKKDVHPAPANQRYAGIFGRSQNLYDPRRRLWILADPYGRIRRREDSLPLLGRTVRVHGHAVRSLQCPCNVPTVDEPTPGWSDLAILPRLYR